jgi:TonB-linked SusC/RagA family outer membrane protein
MNCNPLLRCLCIVIVLLASFTPIFAQQKTVTGKITDQQSGQPVGDVTVSVKGSTVSTVSAADGSFSISLPPDRSVLVFSIVGYASEEVNVANQTTVSVSLTTQGKEMDEVVVIGYGVTKRRDLTGAVSSIKAADIVRTPTFNAVEAMQGRVAGVDITRTSGIAGSGATIRVRGNRSITGSNEPLFIIDGMQGGNVSDLNPNDIESIEVLKDASATAIYGSQGASGVIIVTTKKGVSGKAKISYDAYYGVNGFTQFPKPRLGQDYINMRREAYRNTSPQEWNSPADDVKLFPVAQEWAAVQAGQWVDWYDLANRNGVQQSHNISVRAGTDRTKIFLSGNYFKEEGMLKRNDYTRYSARFNIDQTLLSWAKVGMQSQVAYFKQNRRQDPLSVILSTTPLGLPYDANGNINLNPIPNDLTTLTPLADDRGDTVAVNSTIRSSVQASAYLELTPIKGLTVRSNFGVNITNGRQGIFNSASSLLQRNLRYSMAQQGTAFQRALTWDNVISYNKKIGEHDFTVTAIESYIQNDFDTLVAGGTRQLLGSQLFYALAGIQQANITISSGYIGSNNLAFAGRLNYTYAGKYIVGFTYRADGASRLSPGRKWDYFPSVSAAWNISNEKFMDRLNVVSNLKLRASYGTTGNYGIAVYGTQSGVAASQNMGFGDVQVPVYQFLDRIGNQEFKWEKSATTNIGIDFGLLNNRISGSIDLYRTLTSDIILDRALPRSDGFGANGRIYQNIGETVNKGIEVSLNTRNIQTTNFRWESVFTFTKNHEEITKLITNADIISGVNPETQSLLIGKAITSYYSYRKLGIWQSDKATEAAMVRFGTTPFRPGDIRVEDLNKDSLIDTKDRQYLGSAVPKFIIGLQNNFSYKGFDVGVYLFMRWGQMINAEFMGRYNPSGTGAGPADFDYWTPENPTNDFPRPRKGAQLINYAAYQTLNFIDGSFFKIKTITLGYTLPQRISKKIASDRIRLYATGNNIFTKARNHILDNYDPERGGAESSPISRQVVFGVNFDF